MFEDILVSRVSISIDKWPFMLILGWAGDISMYFIESRNIKEKHFCVQHPIETHQILVEHRTHQIS